jgi:hypothetical protein
VYDLHGFIEGDRVKFQRRSMIRPVFRLLQGSGNLRPTERVLGSTDTATCRNRLAASAARH